MTDLMRQEDKSFGITQIENINCQLELGAWDIDKIDKLLHEAWRRTQTSNEWIIYIVKQFINTPFVFESNLPVLPNGILRVRLQSFDCITFIYYMLALCKSQDFKEFVKNLYYLRYIDPETNLIDNEPDTGNIFDFACDSILINAVNRKFLIDITSDLISFQQLEQFSVGIKRFKRYKSFDINELYVSPKYGERIVSSLFIPNKAMEHINKSLLKSGDLVLFSQGDLNHTTRHF